MKHKNTLYVSTVPLDTHSASSTHENRMEKSISYSISYLDYSNPHMLKGQNIEREIVTLINIYLSYIT